MVMQHLINSDANSQKSSRAYGVISDVRLNGHFELILFRLYIILTILRQCTRTRIQGTSFESLVAATAAISALTEPLRSTTGVTSSNEHGQREVSANDRMTSGSRDTRGQNRQGSGDDATRRSAEDRTNCASTPRRMHACKHMQINSGTGRPSVAGGG